MKVVLVHGLFGTGKFMEKLADHLSSEGHQCLTPTLTPSDGRVGLEVMARQLHSFIDSELEEGERLSLVGFSMGSLISRYYMQELNGHQRVDAFFSISGPHEGTWTAYFYPGKGARQMRPKSSFLQALYSSCHRLEKIPVTSYWTPFDLMIIPAKSSRWAQGEQVCIPSLMHRWMVSDRRLLDHLSDLLQKIRYI